MMDEPEVWPACSECLTAYAYRRGLSLSAGWVWVWTSDCKHPRRKPPPVLVDANGLYVPPSD